MEQTIYYDDSAKKVCHHLWYYALTSNHVPLNLKYVDLNLKYVDWMPY